MDQNSKEYVAPDKPLKDFTDQEREEFMAAMRERFTEDQMEGMESMGQAVKVARGWLVKPENRETLLETLRAVREVVAALRDEINSDHEAGEMSLDAFLESGKLEELMGRVAKRMEAPTMTAERIHALDVPLDKVNARVWSLLQADKDGYLAREVDVASKEDAKAGREVIVAYSIDFSDIKDVSITRTLTPYDNRVYLAVAAYFNTGQEYVSYQQIYNGMGYKGRAGASDLKKIHESVSKMGSARIYVDNLQESEAYESKPHFAYDGSLLPMERVTAVVNGQLAESVIHVFREPPMVTFARDRQQLTTVSLKLLASPISKTNANILLENYLIERISRMRNGRTPKTMLLSTIYKKAGADTTKKKQRTLPKIKKLLEHYKTCQWIKGYKLVDGEKIVISL